MLGLNLMKMDYDNGIVMAKTGIDVIVHIYQDYICLLVETSRVDYIKANRA